MNAVGADQDVAAHGFGVGAGAIEEVGGDATLVLIESAKPIAGVDHIRPEPFLDGAVNHALQPAAMNGKLRNVVTGIEAARVAPDFLAVTGEVMQHVGAD